MRLYSIVSAIAAMTSLFDITKAETHSVNDNEDIANLPDICYGIALSDASDFGPYQAGALIGLLEH